MDNQVDTIDLHQLFTLLWKNIILIGGVTVIITLAVGLFSYYGIEKKYSSSTTLRIVPSSSENGYNYNDIVTSQKLVKEYAYIATSKTVLEDVIDNLDLNMKYEALKASVKVTSIQDTSIISIEVTLNDPDKAKDVANEISRVFREEIPSKIPIHLMSEIDKATKNSDPVSPNVMLNTIIGFVLGAMLSVGFVLLRAFLNNSIKDESDVNKYLNLPVIGKVPNIDKKYTY